MALLHILGSSNIYASFLLVTMLMVMRFWPCLCFTSFVFGDSLVDAGNNDYIFTLSKADSPPYGIDFLPSGGQPTGRFTNGRTIADIVGEALGAKSFPPPYLSPNSSSNAMLGGVNYASGASGILDETGSIFIGRIPLREQINYFEQTRRGMVSDVGEIGTQKVLKGAIFSISIGSNDVLSFFQPSIPLLKQANKIVVSAAEFQDLMISNLTAQLMRLHGLGARKLVVVGVGPLGCIPYVRAVRLVGRRKCSEEVNGMIRGYNTKLAAVVESLNEQYGPEAVFVYGNSYDIVMEIVQNYGNHGFENGDDPCCGGYVPPFICFKEGGGNGNSSSNSNVLCGDRSRYVFWDAYHPTEATNVIVSAELLDGGSNTSSPMNIRQLYSL